MYWFGRFWINRCQKNLTVILSCYQILAFVIILALARRSLRLSSVAWFTRPVSLLTLFFLSPGSDMSGLPEVWPVA